MDRGIEIGAVGRADQVQPVGRIGGDGDQPVGLVAGGFVAPDHVEIDHRAGRRQRAQRMRGHGIGSQQAAFLGGEHGEQDRPLGLDRQRCHRPGQRHNADRARPVVIRAVPDPRAAVGKAVVIVMRGHDQRFGGQRRVRSGQDRGDVVAGAMAPFGIFEMDVQRQTRQHRAMRRKVAVDRGLQRGGIHARSGKDRARYRIGQGQHRDVQFIVGQRLHRQRRHAGHAAADALCPLGIRQVLAVGLWHNDHRNRAVGLCVQRLDPRGGIARVAGPVEA